MLILYGPTGVGKSDFALKLAEHIPNAQIVNMDLGQMYGPLTIGTAKPDWRHEKVPHHLFDIVDEPKNITVCQYRELFLSTIESLQAQGAFPIVVGGSGFYLKSLLFPPQTPNTDSFETNSIDKNNISFDIHENLWDQLHAIDPERAAQIHPNDTYRIERALAIWRDTGTKPSHHAPVYRPPFDATIVHVTRDRDDLYNRINQRVGIMFDQGWLQEVEALKGTAWEIFLHDKKLIGYDLILDYLAGGKTSNNFDAMVVVIQQLTRNYAKRQETFWRMLERIIAQVNQNHEEHAISYASINLTLSSLDLYINQLLKTIDIKN